MGAGVLVGDKSLGIYITAEMGGGDSKGKSMGVSLL